MTRGSSGVQEFRSSEVGCRKSGRDTALEVLCAQKLAATGCAGVPVRVVWSRRMKTTAGNASSRTSTVTLNAALNECAPEAIERTLLHELAHILASRRASGKRIHPHGTMWHAACQDLGIANERRCHSLPFAQKRLARKYLYRCPHCAQTFPRVRPFRSASACLACCRTFNHGRFDPRFLLCLVPPALENTNTNSEVI